jgi:uncharacterized RDD family membrane protein YckC
MKVRLKAVIIDFVFLCFIGLVLSIVVIVIDHNSTYELGIYFVNAVLYAIILCKDIYNGQSLGKKIMNLQVVDIHNKDVSLYKLVLRNIFVFIWPIELILCIIGSDRLGDIIFKTKVVKIKKKETLYSNNIYKIILCFLLVLLILLFVSKCILNFLQMLALRWA